MFLPSVLLLGFSVFTGCHTESSAPARHGAVSEAPSILQGDLMQEIWPVHMAVDDLRAPFEGHPGWAALLMQRDYAAALAAFSVAPALATGQARAHLEMAAVYRQAALLAANATVQIYRESRREEDPPQVDCLVGFAEALLAEVDSARSHLAACDAGDDPALATSRDQWSAWLAAGGKWPPTAALAGVPGAPGAPMPGALPTGGDLPHYRFLDAVEGREIQAGHPGTLLALAVFHEESAVAAAPGSEAIIRQVLDVWRLPLEPPSAGGGSMDDTLLFGSSLLGGEDAAFLAALDRDPDAAIPAFAASSPLAAILAPCWQPTGEQRIEAGCVLERAAAAHDQVRAAMEIRSGGEQGFHKAFVDFVRIGAVRAGEHAAAAVGEDRTTGILRLNVMDFSVDSSADPALLLSIAAWDAGNRNALRATELLHAQIGHLSGLEIARYPLDALQVRLGRESAPGLPMH